MSEKVIFLKGNEEDLPQNRDANEIYFTEDSGKIYLGSKRMGVNIEDGYSKDSIQQENCFAGLKGFYWTSLCFVNTNAEDSDVMSLELSTVNGQYGVEQEFDIREFWSEGDVVSIHSGNKYINCTTITHVTHTSDGRNAVEVYSPQGIGFTRVSESEHITDNAIYVLSKPTAGLCDFGQNSIALGDRCKAINYDTFSAGRDNETIGQYGATFGRQNKAGYCSLTAGRENDIHSDHTISAGVGNISEVWANASLIFGSNNTNHLTTSALAGKRSIIGGEDNHNWNINSAVFGAGNTNKGDNAIVSGVENTNSGANSIVSGMYNTNVAPYSLIIGYNNENTLSGTDGKVLIFGEGNKASGNLQALFGRCTAPIGSTLLAVGNGKDADHRGNAFEVRTDGTCYAGAGGKLATESFINNKLSTAATANTIAYRDANGRFKTATTPVDSQDVTSKSYVDAKVLSSLVNSKTYVDTQTSGLSANIKKIGGVAFTLQPGNTRTITVSKDSLGAFSGAGIYLMYTGGSTKTTLKMTSSDGKTERFKASAKLLGLIVAPYEDSTTMFKATVVRYQNITNVDYLRYDVYLNDKISITAPSDAVTHVTLANSAFKISI